MIKHSDEEMDLLLRDAGRRLRAGSAAVTPQRVVDRPSVGTSAAAPRHRRRLVIGLAAALATAATIVIVVSTTRSPHQSLQNAPTGTGSTATTLSAPAVSTSTISTSVADVPSTTSAITGEATPTVDQVDWDGDGGVCVSLVEGADAVSGCLRGTDADALSQQTMLIGRLGAKTYALVGDAGPNWKFFGVGVTVDDFCYSSALHADSFVLALRCDDAGTMLAVLPATPGDERHTYAVVPNDPAHPVELSELSTTVPGVQMFLGTTQRAVEVTCVVVMIDRGASQEACTVPIDGGLLPFRFLFTKLGVLYLGSFAADGSVGVEAVPAGAALTVSGCTGPAIDLVDAVAASPALVTSIGCGGKWAFVGSTGVFLTLGSGDGGAHLLRQDGDEAPWIDQGGGTSYPCGGGDSADMDDLCASFAIGPYGDAIEADTPLPSLEWFSADDRALDPIDITQQLRDSMPPPESLDAISDAIATQFRTGDEPAPIVVDVPFGDGYLRVVQFTLHDDSTTALTIALWTRPTDAGTFLLRAIQINHCGRGVAESDGQQLCV